MQSTGTSEERGVCMQSVHQPVHWVQGNRPGLVGELVRWHGLYYVQGLGWPAPFEALCAEQLAEIARQFGVSGETTAFSAWRASEFLAGLVMDARPATRPGARLRFLIASDAARGRGLGHDLLSRAIAWSQQRGDPSIWLTTVQGLPAASHLYRKFGFSMVAETIDRTWGSEHREQLWERCANDQSERTDPPCTSDSS
jgi:GNAT superfamily N-acetyltransferase